MKIFKIVAVRDELTQSFLEPTFIESIEEAERLFKYQINSIPLWKANASDYSLYDLGAFDAEEGFIKSEVNKIISGHSVLDRKENTENANVHSIQETTEEK